MEIIKSYGEHPRKGGKTFITQIKLDKRVVTIYTSSPITDRVLRRVKSDVRLLAKFSLQPHESKLFQCKGCKKCKGA
jgi:hypothetical protein